MKGGNHPRQNLSTGKCGKKSRQNVEEREVLFCGKQQTWDRNWNPERRQPAVGGESVAQMTILKSCSRVVTWWLCCSINCLLLPNHITTWVNQAPAVLGSTVGNQVRTLLNNPGNRDVEGQQGPGLELFPVNFPGFIGTVYLQQSLLKFSNQPLCFLLYRCLLLSLTQVTLDRGFMGG